MGIEFHTEPPRKVGDIVRDDKVERIFSNVGYDASASGYDQVYMTIAAEDTATVFKSIFENAMPEDIIDTSLVKRMLYAVSEDMDESVRVSYRRGVDCAIEETIQWLENGEI